MMLYRTEIFTTERTVGMKRWFSNKFNLPNRISRPCVAPDFETEETKNRRILNQSNAAHCKHCACGSGGCSRILRFTPQNRAMFRGHGKPHSPAGRRIRSACTARRHALGLTNPPPAAWFRCYRTAALFESSAPVSQKGRHRICDGVLFGRGRRIRTRDPRFWSESSALKSLSQSGFFACFQRF